MTREPWFSTPDGLYVYYCPICKVGTGDRSWHPVGRAGLIPQTQDEHDCVRIDVSALLAVAEAAENLVCELEEDVKTWGGDYFPDSTDTARAAVAEALSRAGNSQEPTS